MIINLWLYPITLSNKYKLYIGILVLFKMPYHADFLYNLAQTNTKLISKKMNGYKIK